MIDLQTIKVYSPSYQATEWGFGYEQIADLDTVLQQPIKLAVLPVFYSLPHKHEYNQDLSALNLEQFDLVLFTDIEWHSQAELIEWISSTGANNWLLHTAGRWLDESLNDRVVYRPAWSFNFLRWNPPRSDFPMHRPFKFDCLLGARRAHRDFVMLGMQQRKLLDQSITTYRDIFVGHWIDQTPQYIADLWPDQQLQYPYVSTNLNPDWEVKPTLDNSISGIVPWEIYNRTWFSVVCETLASGRVFLSAEKMGKCLQARRLFVIFGIQGFLQAYKNWGFETWGDVIDEGYDTELNDTVRWARAFEQVTWLCGQNLASLVVKLKPRLDHNHHRLYELEHIKRQELQYKILNYLK